MGPLELPSFFRVTNAAQIVSQIVSSLANHHSYATRCMAGAIRMIEVVECRISTGAGRSHPVTDDQNKSPDSFQPLAAKTWFQDLTTLGNLEP
jgi:hypothetical protein